VVFAPAVAAALEEVVDLAAEFGGFGKIAEYTLDGVTKAAGVMANGIRGIQVIVKGLELGFEGFAFAVNRIFLAVSRSIDRLINGAIASINGLTQQLNKVLPGDGIGAIEQFTGTATKLFEDNTAAWSAAMDETMAEMHTLMMQELPSVGIERWVEKVKAKAQEAAEATAAAQARRSMDTLGGGQPAGMSEDELKAMEDRLQKLRELGMTELEIKQMQYDADQELLVAALENQAITRDEYNLLAQEAAQRHADAITDIDQKAAEQRLAIEAAERQAKMQGMQTMFSNLAQLMNTSSRKLFEIGKASAIANAVVSAYEGISLTMSKYPYPLNVGMAAAHGAAAFAQVSAIKSQSFSSGAGAGMNFQGGQPAMPTGGQVAPQQPNRNISISLSGSSFGAGGIRDLIAEINNAVGDGMTLGVTN
jgi:hypothetical protein